jgi:hypothetical protein
MDRYSVIVLCPGYTKIPPIRLLPVTVFQKKYFCVFKETAYLLVMITLVTTIMVMIIMLLAAASAVSDGA